jgi:hypothetical protein
MESINITAVRIVTPIFQKAADADQPIWLHPDGSAPRIVRNWLDGFWLRSYAESAKYKLETIHETH